jgi:hypothetical protein
MAGMGRVPDWPLTTPFRHQVIVGDFPKAAVLAQPRLRAQGVHYKKCSDVIARRGTLAGEWPTRSPSIA